MKIGIIGSGRQGGAIGLQWAKAGHQIVFSSRNPESLKDLVAQAGPGGAGRHAAAGRDVRRRRPHRRALRRAAAGGQGLRAADEGQDRDRRRQPARRPRRRGGEGRPGARHRRHLEGAPAGRAAGARAERAQLHPGDQGSAPARARSSASRLRRDDQEAIAVAVQLVDTMPASIRWSSAGWLAPASSTPGRRST